MVGGGFLINLTNYLYHLITARILGPNDYGTLDSLVSLIAQLSIPFGVISTVIIRYVSAFKGQNRTKTIESFFWKTNKKLLIISLPLLILVFLVAPSITNFLHLPSIILFLLIGFYFIIGLFPTLWKSFVQGLSRFKELIIINLAEGIFRLVLTAALLLLGWGLLGAVLPFFAMVVLSVILTLFLVKDLLRGEKNQAIPEKKEIFIFTLPVFFTNLGVTSLITSDVILAKHFLPPTDAGLYAALSTLSKIIFFAAVPVVSVLFPIISETHAAKQEIGKVIIKGFLLLGLIVGGGLIIFGFFPGMMILKLFGKSYLPAEGFVIYFGLIMGLYTFSFTLLNIFLALKSVKPSIFVCIAALFQIILIVFFHSSIVEILHTLILIHTLLFTCLLLYFILNEEK